MRRSIFLLLICGVALHSTQACFNSYVENEAGIAEGKSLVAQITEHALKSPWTKVRDNLAARAARNPLPETLNDYAVALCHTGAPQKAIEILLGIEKVRPNAYKTATNLGTAYELAGENENALHWIEEGIRRNPKSHERSEWIHAAILQAKLAIAADTNWLETHEILGLDFGPDQRPATPPSLPTGIGGKRFSLPEIRDGLQHQLHERTQFTPKPDAIVSRLIFDYANLVRLIGGEDAGAAEAFPLFQLSAEYSGQYMPQGGVMPINDVNPPARNIDQFVVLLQKRLLHSGRHRGAPPWYRDSGIVVCGLLALLVLGGTAALISGVPMHLNRLILLLPIAAIATRAGNDREYVMYLAIGIGLLAATYLPAYWRKSRASTTRPS